MKRIWMSLVLLAAAAIPASAQDDPVKALQKKVQEAAKKVSSAFIFFPGGSGVLISEDGWLITNHHVIAVPSLRGMTDKLPDKPMDVLLQDGRRRTASLQCTDAVGDIALFKLNTVKEEKFPFVEFADSDKAEIGQYVLAIGAPHGIGGFADPAPDGRHYPSVSLGIVSALHRYQAQYGDCIQTDAAVNPGNSGGPLVDLNGRLLGINGRILTRYMNRVNSGVGFAIASNQIANFLPRMKASGDERRIYHGRITGLELDEHAHEQGGLIVREVASDSPAATRGIRAGDSILSLNGHKVFNVHRFRGIQSAWPADTEMTLTVRRDGKKIDIKVPLEGVEERSITGELLKPPPPTKGSLGATFEEQEGQVVVTFVSPFSPAEDGGLTPGDVVLKVDETAVSSRKTVLTYVQKKKPGDVVTMRVLRAGEEHDLKVKLGRLSPEE